MKKNGFTLVELMIALAIGMVIMLAIYSASELAQRSSGAVGRKVTTQQDARAVLDLMAMEIRMASFNPTRATSARNMWSHSGCTVSAFQARKGIHNPSASTIDVQMDLNANGVIIGAAANPDENIYYSYDGAKICRAVNCGGCQTILGGADSGSNVVNNAAGIPVFRYYDRQDNLIPSAGMGDVQIRNIRRIAITLVVDNEIPDPGTTQPRRMIYSTDFVVRNHVLSP
jgi:prepilin-type N-terminal cleavage/methylation domain-containing protein